MKRLILLLIAWMVCGAWMIANPQTGEVIESSDVQADSTGSHSVVEFERPPNFAQIYWDTWQIILTNPEEETLLFRWVRGVTASLGYIRTQRDCDDFAIIAKAVLAYEGFGNALGLVIDYSMNHAYNCYWYLSLDEKIVLKRLEPQNPYIPVPFPMNDRGIIYW